MQHFVGKVCSIISTSMNRAFDESISREHFVVRIQEISLDGIWGNHPYNEEMVSFFMMSHIISIHEEVELNPSNPEHAQMISDYEEKVGHKVKPDVKQLIPPTQKTKGSILPILNESPMSEADNLLDMGDSSFVDIESLENLAETTRRTLMAYELLGKN